MSTNSNSSSSSSFRCSKATWMHEYVIDNIAEMPTNINLQYENRG